MCINLFITIFSTTTDEYSCVCVCLSAVHAVNVSVAECATEHFLFVVRRQWHQRTSINLVGTTLRRRWGTRTDGPAGCLDRRLRQRPLHLP